ncbi:MAG: ECF transporter S component [Candidatus Korarchaeum sp.]|nr:ECF transporter S component [Candidatus Korarchaeum sp.]MDW8035198.1 ECF transporter S component [Candidatus Korarchaeum sp.]
MSLGRRVSATGSCAALYAIGAFATSYLVSPFGRGQFRPTVVIPALFSIIYGPEVGGVGAAIGTLIADSAKHGSIYLPSLLSAVPGNLIGFYALGRMLRKDFSWRMFSLVSQISLALGCFTVAYLYSLAVSFLGMLPPNLASYDLFLLGTSLALWFFITEYPFVILLVPPVLRAVRAKLPEVAKVEGKPSWLISLTLPGSVFLAISLLLTLTPASAEVMRGLLVKLNPSYAVSTLYLIQLLFAGSGVAMALSGLLLQLRGSQGLKP